MHQRKINFQQLTNKYQHPPHSEVCQKNTSWRILTIRIIMSTSRTSMKPCDEPSFHSDSPSPLAVLAAHGPPHTRMNKHELCQPLNQKYKRKRNTMNTRNKQIVQIGISKVNSNSSSNLCKSGSLLFGVGTFWFRVLYP